MIKRLEKVERRNGRNWHNFICLECNSIFMARGDSKSKSCGCLEEINLYKNREKELKNCTLLEPIVNQKTKVLVMCNNCKNEYKSYPQVLFRQNQKYCYNCLGESRKKTKEGIRTHIAYNTLDHMKQRCYNEKAEGYEDYGGRGIDVCEEWLGENGYVNFCKWADENNYKKEDSIDRIDVNKGYSPNNCRLIPMILQRENKRKQINNKSGYRGVHLYKDKGKYGSRVIYNKISKNLGMYSSVHQAAIVKYYYMKINNIILSDDLEDYRKRIVEWGLERNLTKFDIEVEKRMFKEELDEYRQALGDGDIYETIDALNDMYVVMTQTLGQAGLVKYDIFKDKVLHDYYKIYLEIPDKVVKLGYNFEIAINETLEEIESRRGTMIDGKFTKDKSAEAQSKWYKADYNKALDKNGLKDSINEYIFSSVLGELNDKLIRMKIISNLDIVYGKLLNDLVGDYNIICDETNNTPTTIDNNEFNLDIIFDEYDWKFSIS